MPFVEIEEPFGIWTRREVSFQERRQILLATQPEQRFIKDEIVYIAHPDNFWCSTLPQEDSPCL